MDYELIFVMGLALSVLSIPALLSAYSDRRPPRAAAMAILIGGVLLVLALSRKPGGIALGDIPDMFLRVIGRYLL